MIENEKLDDENANKNVGINIEDNDSENPIEVNNAPKEKEEPKEKDNKDNTNNKLNKEEELNDSFYDENDDLNKSIKVDFSIILVGDSYVGKTSILKKFIDDEFNEETKCTISVDFRCKNLKIDKNLYASLKIFDTAGQEKYRSLTKSYYRQAQGIILVFDLTNEISFSKLNKWINEINENTENVVIILVGNKADSSDRKVDKINAENYAKERNIKYIETSAKEGTNILLLFEELAIDMNKKKEDDNSIVELENVDTFIFRRTELNKQLKIKRESKCC